MENSKEGSQVVSLYLDGNSLSKTPSIDFTPEWIAVPQQFSCDAGVSSKVKMLKATASITSATWDQIVVNVGSSTDDLLTNWRRKQATVHMKLLKHGIMVIWLTQSSEKITQIM